MMKATHDIGKLIPNAYWVIPGHFLVGPYPGSLDKVREQRKIRYLAGLGIRLYVDVTQRDEVSSYGEPLHMYEPSLPNGTLYHHIPIEDRTVPSVAAMRIVLDCIRKALVDLTPVYLHCRGGKYRTGTIVGCFFADHGFARGDGAIEMLSQLRRFQNAEPIELLPNQRALICGWFPDGGHA